MEVQTGNGNTVGLEDSSQQENQSDSRWQENQPIRANASSSSVASAYFNNKIIIPEDQQVRTPGEREREREGGVTENREREKENGERQREEREE